MKITVFRKKFTTILVECALSIQKANDEDGEIRFFQTGDNFYQTTWHKIPEDSNLHNHCSQKIKSHIPYTNIIFLLLLPLLINLTARTTTAAALS
jgi:hypothetical protein